MFYFLDIKGPALYYEPNIAFNQKYVRVKKRAGPLIKKKLKHQFLTRFTMSFYTFAVTESPVRVENSAAGRVRTDPVEVIIHPVHRRRRYC